MAADESKAKPQGVTYRDAGVDIEAGDKMVDQIGPIVHRTYGPRVLASHGGFAGAFRLDYDEKLFARNYKEPVLMACTDGVGSKLLIAIELKRYDTVGIDLVAMNVNDLITCGAEPLFFLDYLAVNKLDPDQAAAMVKGVADGCMQSGCALLGGETAELPDLYHPSHFDMAGFSVGVVERDRLMDPANVQPDDEIIGIFSNGLHSNGYALARKVLVENAQLSLTEVNRTLGEPLGDAMLRPTKIYVKPVLEVLNHYEKRSGVVSMAHITGGGIEGNLPRVLPKNCDAVIRRGSWPIPPIFKLLEGHGVSEPEMYRVFNMGVGYVMVVRPSATGTVLKILEKAGEEAAVIGRIKAGSGQVEFH